MKKAKLHRPRAHRALFDNNSPFRRHQVERKKTAYQRKPKHVKKDFADA